MAELQTSLSTQLHQQVELLQPPVQLLVLQLLQHIGPIGQRATQKSDIIWDELQREKRERMQAIADLHERLNKYATMMAKLWSQEHENSNHLLELQEALTTKQSNISSRGNQTEYLEGNFSENGMLYGDGRENKTSEKGWEMLLNISEPQNFLMNSPKLHDMKVEVNNKWIEEVLNDQEMEMTEDNSTEFIQELMAMNVKLEQAMNYIKLLEVENLNCSKNLNFYQELHNENDTSGAYLEHNKSGQINLTSSFSLLKKQLKKVEVALKLQNNNSSVLQQVSVLNSQVENVGQGITGLETQLQDLQNRSQALQDADANNSLLQKRLEAAEKEIKSLETQNTRLISQKHDLEKLKNVLEHGIQQYQSDFVKCSSLGDQLKKEKANVRILQDDYENCTFTVKNKTKESDQLKVELAAAKAIVGNLTSTISNLTSQVIRVNITGEQKLKNKMSSVVRLLRYTTVMEAAKAGDPETTKFLIETGASVNSRDVSHNLRRTPLHWAAREGFLSVVQLLIQSGASLETKSDAGYTPLLEAAYNGHTDVCRLLLDLGANVSALNIHNNTPLHWAASNNHIATVRLLVQRGANCDARNNDGQTPRSLASDYRHDDIVSWMQYGCGR